MEFMHSSPRNAQPDNETNQRHHSTIGDPPSNWNSFHQSVRILDIDIVDKEHAVEGFDKSDKLVVILAMIPWNPRNTYQYICRQQ